MLCSTRSLGHRVAAPGGHLRRPGRGGSLVGQDAEDRVDHDHGQHGHRPAARGALAAVAHERDEEQGDDQEHREDQDDEGLRLRRAERQQGEQPEERPFRPRVGAGQRRIGRTGRALGPDDGGQDHHDDHRQRGEEGVLQHGVAEEGDAAS